MGFNIFLALSSPCPILVDTMAGSSIMVITTTLYMLFTTLLKEIINEIILSMRNSMNGASSSLKSPRTTVVDNEKGIVCISLTKQSEFNATFTLVWCSNPDWVLLWSNNKLSIGQLH